MTTASKATNSETSEWLTILAERAKALDTIFASGGEVQVDAPLSLRGPSGKTLTIIERLDYRLTNVDKKLRTWCVPASFGDGNQTRTDHRVREGRQLYARDGALAVEGFDAGLREVCRRIRETLCPDDAGPPSAALHSLNLYGRGGHFVAHKDTPRDPSVFGTLVVCLPLTFGGGRLIVEQQSRATFDWSTRWYSSASAPEAAARRIRWAAFFGDVDHRIETVTSGCRATLTYELRRSSGSRAPVTRQPAAAEAAFTAALIEAVEAPKFFPKGGKLGMPCVHLYAVPTSDPTLPGIEELRDHLKGRDRLASSAFERAGLAPRVAPYVYETCAGDSWRLQREVSAREKQMFWQKRLKGSSLERKLPIELHADHERADDVTWLVRPPWVSSFREAADDGRPEPAVELLGETEYSATDYFGNEASMVAFYSAAAILFDVPPASARKPRGRQRT